MIRELIVHRKDVCIVDDSAADRNIEIVNVCSKCSSLKLAEFQDLIQHDKRQKKYQVQF